MTPEDLDQFLIERNKAFEEDELSWAAKILPNASHPRVVEMAFHKARFECFDTSTTKRLESRDWLAANGLTRLNGQPVLPSTPLPGPPQ